MLHQKSKNAATAGTEERTVAYLMRSKVFNPRQGYRAQAEAVHADGAAVAESAFTRRTRKPPGDARYPDNARALSLHSVEGFLQQREIAWLAEFFPRGIDPLFLQRVFRWPVILIEDRESSFGFAQDRLRRQ